MKTESVQSDQGTPGEAIGGAIRDLLSDPLPRAAVRAYAERFGWGPTTDGQVRLLRSIVNRAD
jgi:hypothetical protein